MNETNFEKIYREYQSKVLAICRRQLRNEQDAQDVTQEVFIKVWRNLQTFKGQAQLGTWLHRIALNACIDFHRKHGVFINNGVPFEPELYDWPSDEPISEVQLEEEEELDQRIAVIREFDSPIKEIVLLIGIEGLQTKDVARLLGLSNELVELLRDEAEEQLMIVAGLA